MCIHDAFRVAIVFKSSIRISQNYISHPSYKLVLQTIIPVEGVNTVSARGEKCTMFLDVIGDVAGYPGSNKMIDAFCSAGSSSCTLCRLPRYNRENFRSRYGLTSSINGINTSSVRNLNGHIDLRHSSITSSQEYFLGMMNLAQFQT